MIIILGMDGLEYEYIVEFGCKNLMQKSFGKTDISEFGEPRTVVIWSSFLTGKNMEKEVLNCKNLWDFRIEPSRTFFSKFKRWKAIDVPGLSYYGERHKKERELLKGFFEKRNGVEEYDSVVFENHKKIKEEFFEVLNNDYDMMMCYFALADVIGHLSFGIKHKMKIIYEELDEIVKTVKEKRKGDTILIISDHGMKAVGRFGDHSNYGFWSLNRESNLDKPKITQFRKIIENLL
jgi:hypothetical protein